MQGAAAAAGGGLTGLDLAKSVAASASAGVGGRAWLAPRPKKRRVSLLTGREAIGAVPVPRGTLIGS